MATLRLTFVGLVRKSNFLNYKDCALRGTYTNMTCLRRSFTNVPLEYNERDPAPLFFSTNVQKSLKYLTRPNYDRVFRKRFNKNDKVLTVPQYKFMTDAELKAEYEKASERAEYLLHMPPVVKISKKVDFEITKDPALSGQDASKFVFTDISFGSTNSDRLIVVREPDGSLHHADHDIRKRLNQTYFPMDGRTHKEPSMFADDTLFEDVLMRGEYEFILDRACVQYEPNEPLYQRIVSRVYLRCDENKAYEKLRSTRHFGPMAFYLAWNNMIDGLILELLQNSAIREVVTLINLQRRLNPGTVQQDDTQILIEQILEKQNISSKENSLLPIDAQLDEKCVECVYKYVQNNSSKKSLHELALQTYQQLKQKNSIDEGVRLAHGSQI